MCFRQSRYIDNGVFVEGDLSSITRERMFHIDLVFIIVIGYILAPTPSIGTSGTILAELPGV